MVMETKQPLITISREKGSGGKPVAFLVLNALQKPWKIYDQDTLEQIAHENEMKSWFQDQTTQEARDNIKKQIDALFGDRFKSLNTYNQDLIFLLSAIGYNGHAIIVGRGAHILFPQALKVRLICAIDQRIAWIKQYEHLTTKEAVEVLKQSDMKKNEFVHTLYNNDLKIPYHYDIIVRTSDQLKLEDAADAIVNLARRRFTV